MRVKRFFLPIVCLAYLSSLFANDKNKLTLEDIFDSEKYSETIVKDIIWNQDGSAFTYAKQYPNHDYEVIEHEVKSGKETLIISSKNLEYDGRKVGVSAYGRIDNSQLMLVAGRKDKIWRHSWQASHYLYDLKSHKLTPLANENPRLRNVKLSPDGMWVGFVRDFNIYICDVINHEEQAVTKNGNGNILNGEFDWVYEEEFGLADAWSWSPDSKKIAFWQTDQTRVKEFHLLDELPLYNEVFKLKYPKVGEQNAVVKIGVYDLESGDTKWMDLGAETDIYIPRIFWTTSAKQLAILRLNRLQNHLKLLLADAESGNTKTIIDEQNDTWIDVRQDVLFLKNYILKTQK